MTVERMLQEEAMNPEILLSAPRLTEKYFKLFIQLYQHILFTDDPMNFRVFSASRGVTLRRLNCVASKISMPPADGLRQSLNAVKSVKPA
jgi:hypothetical protein